MRTHTVFGALAIAALTLTAGCGTTPESAVTAPTTPALTPYQRAYPVICQGATPTTPPTDAPTLDPRPEYVRFSWRQGFCRGQEGVDLLDGATYSTLHDKAVAAAREGDAARQALTATPPRCADVIGTPVEDFCP